MLRNFPYGIWWSFWLLIESMSISVIPWLSFSTTDDQKF
ncbi:hypothetical protein Tmari_0972 [Thermotoga maritima MSB8]|nr:hypothetical protein Tmari_0972 [Thermotoga maritima MSB8]